jgi:anti-sigma factor RsiW
MDSFPRNLSRLAATAVVLAGLSATASSFAADQAATVIVPNKTSTAHVKHHVPTRMAYHAHPVRPVASDLGCSSAWCGRQFVLMVGIGY